MTKPRATAVSVDPTGLTNVTSTDVQGAIEDLDAASGGSGYTDEQVRDVIGATLVAGTGTSITVNDPGDTITIGVSSSGGALAQSYVGTTTVGGSVEALVTNRYLLKKITVSTPGMLVSIGANLKDSGTAQVSAGHVFVLSDSAGSPGVVIAEGAGTEAGNTLVLNTTARWLDYACSVWLPSADYWLAFGTVDNGSTQIAYTTGGSDRVYTATGSWVNDPSYSTVTTSSNNYSIRGSIIR